MRWYVNRCYWHRIESCYTRSLFTCRAVRCRSAAVILRQVWRHLRVHDNARPRHTSFQVPIHTAALEKKITPKVSSSVLTSVLSLVLTPVLSFFSSDSLLVSLVVFCLCWIAVDGSCVNSCSGGIRWTPWGHCRREVEWRTMHQMDHGYRKESWRISTANDWASYEKREFIQSVFFTRVSFLSHVRIFCWGLVFIF